MLVILMAGAGQVGRAQSVAMSAGAPSPPEPLTATTMKQAVLDNPHLAPALISLVAAGEQGGSIAASDYAGAHGLKLKDGGVQVIIEAAAGDTVAASQAVTASGAHVEMSSGNLVQATVPPGILKKLAADPSVLKIREPMKPVPSAVTSEGVADIGANIWQTGGQNGAGVKVAVLDSGFQDYDARITSGDLPAGVITHSARTDGDITGGGNDHGTACAEIFYDVAPGVTLYLVNFGTEVELESAVNYLIGQGVDVISASWSYPGSSPGDGTGLVNDLVTQFNNSGGVWANAAGNGARNHWGGPFQNPAYGSYLNFSGGDITNDVYLSSGETLLVFLTWNEWPLSTNDYDLYLYRSGYPNPVAWSDAPQNSSTPASPQEIIAYTVPSGQGGTYGIAIQNYSANGAATMDLISYPAELQYQVSAGSLMGQPADSPYALTAGAVYVDTNNLESYSSQGPTTDGRVKPDLVAPDCTTTQTYGNHGFCGTSASTPHTAGAAALMLDAHPTWSPASIRNILQARATDLGTVGKDNLYGYGKLKMGSLPAPGAVSHLFSWYDQFYAGMQDWVIMANPSTSASATADVMLGPELMWEYSVSPGAIVTPQYQGAIGGPVDGLSLEGNPLLMSQRILYNGNFTETPSVREADLVSDYYLPWYDESSPGMRSWVMIANRGAIATTADVYIHGVLKGSYNIAPGSSATPEFTGVLDGPVRVVSSNSQPLIVSERVTYKGSFSETLGIPASSLGDEYRLAWYDQLSPGMRTWVLAANPGAVPVTAEIYLGGNLMGTYNIPAGGEVTPQFDGMMTGPVRVRSTGGEPLIVSERTLYGNAFEEVTGARPSSLGATSWLTWYDQLSSGMKTWILMSNQGSVDTTAEIYLAGAPVGGPYTLPADGSVVVATFPGSMNGPVKVVSGGEPVLVSERTIYNSSFNEITSVVSP